MATFLLSYYLLRISILLEREYYSSGDFTFLRIILFIVGKIRQEFGDEFGN